MKEIPTEELARKLMHESAKRQARRSVLSYDQVMAGLSFGIFLEIASDALMILSGEANVVEAVSPPVAPGAGPEDPTLGPALPAPSVYSPAEFAEPLIDFEDEH